ncbi:hypothetical protein DIPPA_26816 [Diplonema papillatum]|nr:hypothetical protein DIPPA_26816 [Diplonema papillatum]
MVVRIVPKPYLRQMLQNSFSIPIFGAMVVNKLSSRGKQQPRFLVLNDAFLLLLDKHGHVKRAIDLCEMLRIVIDESQNWCRFQQKNDRNMLIEFLSDGRNDPGMMREFIDVVLKVRACATRIGDPELAVTHERLFFEAERPGLLAISRDTTSPKAKLDRYLDAKRAEKHSALSARSAAAPPPVPAIDPVSGELTFRVPLVESRRIGLELGAGPDNRAVIAPGITDCAADAGVIPGVITKLDGNPCTFTEALQYIQRVKGNPASEISITLKPNREDPRFQAIAAAQPPVPPSSEGQIRAAQLLTRQQSGSLYTRQSSSSLLAKLQSVQFVMPAAETEVVDVDEPPAASHYTTDVDAISPLSTDLGASGPRRRPHSSSFFMPSHKERNAGLQQFASSEPFDPYKGMQPPRALNGRMRDGEPRPRNTRRAADGLPQSFAAPRPEATPSPGKSPTSFGAPLRGSTTLDQPAARRGYHRSIDLLRTGTAPSPLRARFEADHEKEVAKHRALDEKLQHRRAVDRTPVDAPLARVQTDIDLGKRNAPRGRADFSQTLREWYSGRLGTEERSSSGVKTGDSGTSNSHPSTPSSDDVEPRDRYPADIHMFLSPKASRLPLP